jgi:hypothetical protein
VINWQRLACSTVDLPKSVTSDHFVCRCVTQLQHEHLLMQPTTTTVLVQRLVQIVPLPPSSGELGHRKRDA